MLGARRGWEEWKGALCVRDWCELIDGRPQYEELSAQGHGWKAKLGTPVVKCHIIICHCASIDACGGIWVHLTVCALSLCGLIPVGNRLRRLIFPLPVPVDRVSRAWGEAEISRGAMHRQSPRYTAAPHACNSSHGAPKHANSPQPQLQELTLVVWPRWHATQDMPWIEMASCQHKTDEKTSVKCTHKCYSSALPVPYSNSRMGALCCYRSVSVCLSF